MKIRVIVTLLLLSAWASAQTFTVLHQFRGGLDGAHPLAGVTLDAGGTVWGTTYQGGSKLNTGQGIVYGIRTSLPHTETVLMRFNTADGKLPVAGVTQDGTLVGMTSLGGAYHRGGGAIYAVDSQTKVVSVLHSFTNQEGASSWPLATDGKGGVWGSYSGGIFVIRGGQFSVMVPGVKVTSPLLSDGQGGFYGTSPTELFHVDGQGNLTTVYSYSAEEQARQPQGQLAIDAAGNIYGAFYQTTTQDDGGIYEVSQGTLTVLWNFGGKDGCGPEGVTLGIDGTTLYGTTQFGGTMQYGNVWELAAGQLTSLYQFQAGKDGANPVAPVVQGPDGTLYGTARLGGALGWGTTWAISLK